MSLDIHDDEITKKFQNQDGIIGSGKSPYEHAGTTLTDPYRYEEIPDGKGGSKIVKELNPVGRTELPAPANTAILLNYSHNIDVLFSLQNTDQFSDDEMLIEILKDKQVKKALSLLKNLGQGLRNLNLDFEVAMMDKNGNAKNLYAQVASASALTRIADEKNNALARIEES